MTTRTRTRYVFKLPVVKVEKRKHIGRILLDGSEENVTYSWVAVIGQIAFAFDDEPELKAGDRVKLTIEKEQTQ